MNKRLINVKPLSLETKKSCRNFDLRAGRSWRGCRDRWCPSSCPSILLPFFAHSPTRSPLWMRLRDHCWHPQCHSHHQSQVIMSTPPARPVPQGREIPVTGKLPDDQTHLSSWTHLSEIVSHILHAELQSFCSFCRPRFFEDSDPMNMERKQWYGKFQLETRNAKI